MEREDQAIFLQDIHCAYAQGFLYCTPPPPSELQQWLVKRPRPFAGGAPASVASNKRQ